MAIYKDDKTGTWYAQFRYRDWQGNSKSTTKRGFKTKRDAKSYEAEYKRDALQPAHLTISQLADGWLKALELRKVKPNTLASYKTQLRHILPYFSNKRVDKLTPADLLHWQAEIDKLGLSSHTIADINQSFCGMLNHAVRVYGLPSNPFRKIQRTGKHNTRTDVWTIDEFNAFIGHCDKPLYKIIFLVLFYSGMRIGEVMALTEADLNFASNTISITKTWDDRLKVVSTPKTTSSVRTIAMPTAIMHDVKQYLELLPVIPERPFGIHLANTVRQYFVMKQKEASLPPLTMHGLRHSHASFLIAHNVSLPAIARRLGHKNASITLSIYSHFYRNDDKEIANLFDNLAK